MAARPEIATAVIVHDRRVLLVRRRVAEGSLSWQFPAGKIGPGESAEFAMASHA
jgi:8-oxo-dGTP diphosphatase